MHKPTGGPVAPTAPAKAVRPAAVKAALTRGIKQAVDKDQRAIDMPLLAELIPAVMLALDKVPNMTGQERKAIMLEVLQSIAQESSEAEREHLVKFIKTVLPILIDIVAAAMKGRVELHNYIQLELPSSLSEGKGEHKRAPDDTPVPSGMYT